MAFIAGVTQMYLNDRRVTVYYVIPAVSFEAKCKVSQQQPSSLFVSQFLVPDGYIYIASK